MPAARQRGSALFIALITLVTMSLAGIALVRSVDTSNLIAGNLAFRQAALQATDAGVETAVNELSTIATSSQDSNYPSGCATGACNYYPLMQSTDSRGVPTVIDWDTVPSATVNTDYAVQYVIDRLCTGTAPVTNITENCLSESATTTSTAGTQKVGGTKFTSSQMVYYRVSVRATGPRNTVSMVQVILGR
jgi:Tfp pilus assembly protein PilX